MSCTAGTGRGMLAMWFINGTQRNGIDAFHSLCIRASVTRVMCSMRSGVVEEVMVSG
jgi:hypothetical protein